MPKDLKPFNYRDESDDLTLTEVEKQEIRDLVEEILEKKQNGIIVVSQAIDAEGGVWNRGQIFRYNVTPDFTLRVAKKMTQDLPPEFTESGLRFGPAQTSQDEGSFAAGGVYRAEGGSAPKLLMTNEEIATALEIVHNVSSKKNRGVIIVAELNDKKGESDPAGVIYVNGMNEEALDEIIGVVKNGMKQTKGSKRNGALGKLIDGLNSM